MPSLQVVEVVVNAHPFENAAMAPNATADEDDDDKTVEMSDSDVDEVLSCKRKSAVTEVEDDDDSNRAAAPSSSCNNNSAIGVDTSAKLAPPSSASKKRRVTPNETTPTSKKKQQKKVNQMNLSNFFHKVPPGQKPPLLPSNVKRSPVASKAPQSSSPTCDSSAPAKKAATPVKTQSVEKCETESMAVEAPADKAEPCGNTDAASVNTTNAPVEDVVKPTKPMTTPTESLQNLPAAASDDSEVVVVSEESDTAVAAPKAPKATAPKNNAASKAKKASLGTAVEQEVVEISESRDGDKADPAPEKPIVELSEDRKALLEKHSEMKRRCQQRFEELVQEAREGVDDEDFDMPELESNIDLSSEDEFPDAVVKNMALLIEGSTLPLSKLASTVCKKLQECHQKEWSEDSVSAKIKLIAERKPYLDSASAFKNDVVGKYEDESVDRMWRWEFGIIEVLPSAALSKVRKARSARRKFLNHYNANQKLLKSLEDADSVVRDMNTKKLDSILGKIGKDEEKVLKFDREAEMQRLAQLVRRQKDQEQEAKRQEKERKKEEAEKKRLEKENEKLEAAQAKEAEKRKKTEKRERQEQEKKQKEQQKKQILNKQKACLMSFFAKPASKQSKSTEEPSRVADSVDKEAKNGEESTSNDFKPDDFRSLIDSQQPSERCLPLFPSLSNSAIQSRKRRTRRVPLSVYVTVMPESNGFDEQPFAEQQIIHIPNKYRFLSFHEDYRPPYHGTWSKRSKVITGRTPFNKDTTYLDYDYDSEAEWEEGDDEIGEDVDDDANNQDDEEEEGVAAKVYDYDDGFCVADDQYLDIDEDVDEETKALYKKKLQRADAAITSNRICIIGPAMGGKPPSDCSVPELMEGFEKDEAIEILAAHTGKQLCHDLLWLDAFAPDKIDELEPTPDTEKPPSTASSNKDEHTVEEMKALATFAHHCTLNSKEKLIEELRNANPDAFGSRAKATRKLDSIAEKKKHPSGSGVYWEVNTQVLEELQLGDVLAKKLPVSEAPATAAKAPSTKTSSDSSSTGSTKTSSEPLKTKKRKNSDSSACSEKAAVFTKKTQVVKGTEESPKRKSPGKKSASLVASASAMMNFLQPRKKPKGNVAAPTEAAKP